MRTPRRTLRSSALAAAGLAGCVVAGTVLTAPAVARPAPVAPDPAPTLRAAPVTTVGSVPNPAATLAVCGTPIAEVQTGIDAGSPSYVIPFNGVVTSFSHRAGPAAGGGRLRAVFYGLTDTADVYSVKTYSANETLVGDQVNTFATRLQVHAGDLVGMHASAAPAGVTMTCSYSTSSASDILHYNFAADPTTQNPVSLPSPFSPKLLNLAVTLEPDADGDGYGDVTQDSCPTDPAAQGACPDKTAPQTTITDQPARRTTKRRVSFSFKSNEKDAHFECSLDGRAFKACVSPARFRARKLGRHTLLVRAIDPAGNVDATPAAEKWRRVRRL